MNAPTLSRAPSQAVTQPPLYGDRRRWGLVQADSLALLPRLPDASIDCVITDPPYGIAMSGLAWDGADIEATARTNTGLLLTSGQAFQAWTTDWAAECLRVLKPGSYLAAFGASRTSHRLAAGVEDAGFEIRDQLIWAYGSGVPKSRRISGDRGSGLKPAYEPVILARKSLIGTIDTNLAQYGTGALNIGAGRIDDETRRDRAGRQIGRWPANMAWSHHPRCAPRRCHPECPRPLLDRGQASAPSRFFWSSKASRGEREAGCEELPKRQAAIFSTKRGAPRAERGNHHVSVKPTALMRWITRLVCPVGGVVLDPFAGSGSTGIAAILEGRQYLGVEKESAYVQIARARLAHWAAQARREDAA